MASYERIKQAVIEVVDDFTKAHLVGSYAANGSKQYSAATELSALKINDPVLAVMPIRFNKALRFAAEGNWSDVGPLDLLEHAAGTIGDLIKLACRQSGTKLPHGEPT